MPYIVEPKKPPKEMTRIENLEWELACLQKWYSLSKDENHKTGYTARIQEINVELKRHKADTQVLVKAPVAMPESTEKIVEPFSPEIAKEQLNVPVPVVKKKKPAKANKPIVSLENQDESTEIVPILDDNQD